MARVYVYTQSPQKAARDKAKAEGVQRQCLKCRQEFLSIGAHNRLCWKCAHENQRMGSPRYF